ncbi:MAG: glycosyltransferase family 4 protein [Polaribacter sp.]|nr:glycosyltransferase family 4 protein [Polaribacter sp.]
MNIGMILDSTFPPDPRVENEAISLVQNGFNVFLFCLKYADEPEYEVLNGIHVKRYPSNQIEYKLSALAYTIPVYSFLMRRKIAHFIASNKITALHVHDIRIAAAVFAANKKHQLPVVLDLHDNMPEVMKLYPHLQKFPGKYIISPRKWKQKEAQFIVKAHKVITVSPHFVKNLEDRFPREAPKFVLVPNTIRASFFENFTIKESLLDKYENNFVLLYLGDTHLRRGLQTAISAVNLLKESLPEIKLVIVGKNTTDVVLKRQVADLKLENFVDFEGWQEVSLFQSYITASDVCISPLHRNLQHDVAYANKIFQYMSLGKPLLVSNATAQKELVERTNSGLVHLEQNVDDFSEKVKELYNNPSLRSTLGTHGEVFIKNEFSWEHVAKALINIYKNIPI